MIIQVLSSFVFGATTVFYQIDRGTGQVGLELVPTARVAEMVPRNEKLDTPEIRALPEKWRPTTRVGIDSLVQLKCVGESYPGNFAQGRTMRNSASTLGLHYDHQDIQHQGDVTTVVTYLDSPRGYVCEHRLSWHEGDPALTIQTTFQNPTDAPISLEMLSSFSLGGITPFDPMDAPGRLVLHRFRAAWSAEGRLESIPFEQLQLEPAWIDHNASSERFGQAGTMPVNGFFPFVAVEDKKAHVLWGAQLAWPGSWQMEAYRLDDCAAISGGLADREFGQWLKVIKPHQSFATPLATVAAVSGDIDDLCQSLTAMQQRAADLQPGVEADLPIVCNEWCTSWGTPTQQSLLAIADRLKGTPTKYLVIDAGWYAPSVGDWGDAQGDWIPSRKLFPNGIAATAAAIRERGLIPGLWFEMEDCGKDSQAFQLTEHHLKRDGLPITVNGRRFWDLRDSFAVDYLDHKVIGLLREAGFGYLKVDYNDTIGIGADGAESPGEGLRQHVAAVENYFQHIRRELPELVLENCASGGHRLEPGLMSIAAMGSFSDAHETPDIPIIAANLHRLILPRQSQIWAVLHRADSEQRIRYSLAATFLGRMCLSGEITQLTESQWQSVLRAENLYREVSPLIKNGASRRYGPAMVSWRHPEGWQAIVRKGAQDNEVLVVAHTFAASPSAAIAVPLPGKGKWQVVDTLLAPDANVEIRHNQLLWHAHGEYDSAVIHLRAQKN